MGNLYGAMSIIKDAEAQEFKDQSDYWLALNIIVAQFLFKIRLKIRSLLKRYPRSKAYLALVVLSKNLASSALTKKKKKKKGKRLVLKALFLTSKILFF